MDHRLKREACLRRAACGFLSLLAFCGLLLVPAQARTLSPSFPFRSAYGSPAAPDLSAFDRAAVLDLNSQALLASANGDAAFVPTGGAVTMMTAYLALTRLNPDEVIPVREEYLKGVNPEVAIGLSDGDEASVRDLVASMVLRGAQDSAAVLAGHISGGTEAFAALMNETAQSLQMSGTLYTDPTGVYKEEQRTTALDLTRLAAALQALDENGLLFSVPSYTTSFNSEELPSTIASRTTMLAPDEETYDQRVTAGYGGGSSQAEGFNGVIRARVGNMDLLIAVSTKESSERRTYLALTALLDELGANFDDVDVTAQALQLLNGASLNDVPLLPQTDAPLYLTVASGLDIAYEDLSFQLSDPAAEPVEGQVYTQATIFLSDTAVGTIPMLAGAIAPQEVSPEPEQPEETPVPEDAQAAPALQTQPPQGTGSASTAQPGAYERFGLLLWSLLALFGGAVIYLVLSLVDRAIK